MIHAYIRYGAGLSLNERIHRAQELPKHWNNPYLRQCDLWALQSNSLIIFHELAF